MIIKKILKLKNNKYKIIFDDDVIITYDNVILDNNLLFKKTLDKDLYNKIIKDTEYYDVYNKCVKYIMKSRKCEKQVVDFLNKFDISDLAKEKIINKLKEINLINDIEFVKAYINDKIYLSKNGINKIKKDLLSFNIDQNIIEDELNKIDKSYLYDILEKLIIKKINSNNKYSNKELRQKLLVEFTNLGYNRDDILNIIDNNISSDFDVALKEFNKQYNKLKIKYSGYELKTKLKQKMFSKGFSAEYINDLIEKI